MARNTAPTVAIGSSGDPGLSGHELRPLWGAFGPLVILAARMNQRELPRLPADQVRQIVDAELDRAVRYAAVRNVDAADVEEARFAVGATLNEAAKEAGGEWRTAWERNPIRLAQQAGVAGEVFFRKYDQLRAAHRYAPLGVYGLCLLAGIRGVRAMSKEERVRNAEIALEVKTSHVDPSALGPDGSPKALGAPPRASGASLAVLTAMAVAGSLALGLIVLGVVGWAAFALSREIAQQVGGAT